MANFHEKLTCGSSKVSENEFLQFSGGAGCYQQFLTVCVSFNCGFMRKITLQSSDCRPFAVSTALPLNSIDEIFS